MVCMHYVGIFEAGSELHSCNIFTLFIIDLYMTLYCCLSAYNFGKSFEMMNFNLMRTIENIEISFNI